MCEVCWQTPCHPRCPNAPEPRAIHRCAYCGEGIIAGEEYIEVDGKYYHGDCISGMSLRELAETFDFRVETAQEE